MFTAEPPAGVGPQKRDATVGSMIALLKYGTGTPFHRAEKLQGSLRSAMELSLELMKQGSYQVEMSDEAFFPHISIAISRNFGRG